MQKLSEIIADKNNVTNVNRDINNNDINVNGKYALDKSKFIPNTEKSQLAEEIASKLNDIKNYASYLDVVNVIGCSEARRLLSNVLSDIEEKKNTKTPVRKNGAYFMWKYKNRRY